MCKEEGLSIKWIFNRTNKFQFVELTRASEIEISELIVKTPYYGTFYLKSDKITPREKLIDEN